MLFLDPGLYYKEELCCFSLNETHVEPPVFPSESLLMWFYLLKCRVLPKSSSSCCLFFQNMSQIYLPLYLRASPLYKTHCLKWTNATVSLFPSQLQPILHMVLQLDLSFPFFFIGIFLQKLQSTPRTVCT